METKQRFCVVKVQLSVASNVPERRMLIYNEKRDIQNECIATKEMIEMVAGEAKSFWRAEIKDEAITLVKKVSWRDW